MFDAMAGSSHAVHLVGIIKETRDNRYHDAHEATCKVLADAAERVGLQRLVYLSILGSQPHSDNPCLASKGRAESLLLTARTPALILQVPMVLGEDDYATRALNKRAHKTWNVILRASSREQPIYAEDCRQAHAGDFTPGVVSAIVAGLSNPGLIDQRVLLAGPESLTQRLVHKVSGATRSNRCRQAHAGDFTPGGFRLHDGVHHGESAGTPAAHTSHAWRAGSR